MRALYLAPNARLGAWRMSATRSAAAAARATSRDESARRSLVTGVPALGGASARLAILANRRPECKSRWLLLPRVAFSNFGRPGCDSLHRPGLRCFSLCPKGDELEACST